MSDLALQRSQSAQRLYEASRLQLVSGTADVERIYHWSFRVLDADRELGDAQAAYGKHLERMERLVKDASRHTSGPASPEAARELAKANFFHAEALFWLKLVDEEPYAAEAAAQLELARGIEAAQRSGFVAGASDHCESPCLWSVRLLQAERDAGNHDEVALYRSHLKRLLELEPVVRRRRRAGELPSLELATCDFFRWEAEYWAALTGARRGRSRAFAATRQQAARAVYAALSLDFEPGTGTSDRLYSWSLRWLRADRDLREEGQDELSPSDALATLEEHHERLASLLRELREKMPPGVAADLALLDYFVLEAQAWLDQARQEA